MSDPWDVEESAYPKGTSSAEQLGFLVNYAVLAPSSHNTQPWRFVLSGQRLSLYADRTRRLPVIDPDDRELFISCGSALALLRVAARYFGHELHIELQPEPTDPDLLASIEFGEPHGRQPKDTQLFFAILARRTTREVFAEKPVPGVLVDAFKCVARAEKVAVKAIQDRPTREAIAALVAEADRLQFADPSFRRELALWLSSRRSSRRDGIPAEGFDLPDSLTGIGALTLRTFDVGRGVAARDAEIAAGSPLLLMLGSHADSPLDWLHTGLALAQVLLQATASDVTASYLNQPVEVAALRSRLARLLQFDGYPQVLMRLGYSERGRPSLRRPVNEVLVNEVLVHEVPPVRFVAASGMQASS